MYVCVYANIYKYITKLKCRFVTAVSLGVHATKGAPDCGRTKIKILETEAFRSNSD